MIKSTFEEEINKNGKLIYPITGISMLPLLRQTKDLAIIEKVNRPLKRYDVPLYKKDDGRYILHRILNVRKEDYVICGDNCLRKEYGITNKDIVGVLCAIVRNNKEISVNNFGYRLYSHLWCSLFFIRVPLTYLVRFSKRVVRKLIKIFSL